MRLSDHPDYVKYVPLKKWEFGFLVHFQKGLCGCGCGRPLEFGPRKIREEHLAQRALGGEHDVQKNCSLWVLNPCALAKDKRDAFERKKLRSLTKSTKKSQAPKAKIPSRPMQTKKDLGKDWARHDD